MAFYGNQLSPETIAVNSLLYQNAQDVGLLEALGALNPEAGQIPEALDAPFKWVGDQAFIATEGLPPELQAAAGAGAYTLASIFDPSQVTKGLKAGKGLLQGFQNIDNLLALPNPFKNNTINQMERLAKWEALDKATKNFGKQNKSGRYVGGPVDVLSPQKKEAITRKYASRIEDSLDAGIPPGYFYEEGRNALTNITDSPAELQMVADLMGPTSTQVGPYQNVNYMIRSLDQNAMGVPTEVGLYPNSLRPRIDAVIAGEDPWKGYKVDRYSNLLGAGDAHTNPYGMMPPNDQWEGYGVGFPKGHVPTGPTQVAWADNIRGNAVDKVNKKRVAKGEAPLNLEEGQELHWKAIRSESDGVPIQLVDEDTIQGSLPYFEFQHSYEAEPGLLSGLVHNMDQQAYLDQFTPIFTDEMGKDPLIRAMQGRLQNQAFEGPGVYKGNVTPSLQSRSYVSHIAENGLDPASEARTTMTEAFRRFALGQDAYAGHVFVPGGKGAKINAAQIDGVLDADTTLAMQNILDEATGLPGAASIVPSETGYRVLNTWDIPAKDFKAAVSKISAEPTWGNYKGIYDELPGYSESYLTPNLQNLDDYGDPIVRNQPWQTGQATKAYLDTVDTLGASFPGAAAAADSQATRDIAGRVAEVYKQLEAAGQLSGSHKLSRALEALASGGTDALRALYEKGLAPAAAVAAVLAAEDLERFD